MIDHATEILGEAAEAVHKIRILSAMCVAGMASHNTATALAEILSLARGIDQPLAALAKEMVDLERGRV